MGGLASAPQKTQGLRRLGPAAGERCDRGAVVRIPTRQGGARNLHRNQFRGCLGPDGQERSECILGSGGPPPDAFDAPDVVPSHLPGLLTLPSELRLVCKRGVQSDRTVPLTRCR